MSPRERYRQWLDRMIAEVERCKQQLEATRSEMDQWPDAAFPDERELIQIKVLSGGTMCVR